MIEELHIRNYALIDTLSLSFEKGFNVLTGETGAGKSILIGSLGLLLGQKSSPEAVREGAESLEVSGVVLLGDNPEALEWLEERGIAPEEDRIILRRVVKKNGRGSCYIQGVPVTIADLEQLTAGLVDLHGQHEHQSLMGIDNHRKVLDRFAGCEDLDRQVYQKFVDLAALRKELDAAKVDEKNRLRDMELLQFAMEEIEGAHLSLDEEKDLEAERDLLSQGEKLFFHLSQFHEAVSVEGGRALGLIQEALGAFRRAVDIDPSQEDLFRRWESACLELEDVYQGVRSYQDSLDFSPQRLEECEGRLAEIHRLGKKYGPSVAEILEYRRTAEETLARLQNWEADREALAARTGILEKEILSLASNLSQRRKEGAGKFSEQIQERLGRLGMAKARFQVDLAVRESSPGKNSCGPHGWDKVEFLISPNRGESLKPLRAIASGGEISRIMLALKSVLADKDEIQSLIFDEVDAGIGGEVALAVGDHLAELGTHKQVLCITHLASIAVRADKHIKVEKGVEAERTLTRIIHVTGRERREEIARMLSGDSRGEASLTHAEELLRRYQPRGY